MKKNLKTTQGNNNYKPKKVQDGKSKTNLYEKDSRHVQKKIIEKYLQKGFESLSVEELAFTLIEPTFESEFKKISGTAWPIENKSKAKERLNYSKFNIQWSVSVNNKSPAAMLKTPFGILFTLVERGDVQKVTEFFRKNAQYMNEIISLVDNNKKSLLHVAAKVGNVNMVVFLISKKFSVYFRDKFLRTPLHLACQFGREVCADELIKAGSQILARDSIGRTCLHYAACSDSTNLVSLILGKEPDLVTARDTYGRTPLHYSVWNGTSEQVKIVIKLLESKAEVDALDEEGMTSLHFAAEAGKGKIIPILLKYGANPFIRDGRTGRTAIELACNDRIREMIIVYTSKDYEPQLSLLKLYGQKIPAGQEIENGGIGYRKSKSKGKKNKTVANGGEEEFEEKIGNLLQNTYRKKLLDLLRAIQLFGVKTMQHMTKPELYSGSWLEKINNANDFYAYISRLSPPEAILSIYNVLYPYSDKLPKSQGEEPDLANFFNLNAPKEMQSTTKNIENESDLFNTNFNKNNTYSNNSEIAILKEQIKKLNQKIDENKEKMENAEITKLKLEVEKYQLENDTLKKQGNELTTQISLLHENVRNYEKKQDKLQKNVDTQKDKLIKALNNQIGNLSIEMNILKNDNLNLTQKGNFSQKNGKYINPKLIDTQSKLKTLTLEEEKNIYVFKNLCNKTNKGLYNILLDYDRDNDFYILKQEFISVMDYIQLPFDQRDTILKISGFDTHLKLSINSIVSSFFDREDNKIILLNQILFNIIYKLSMTKKTVEDLYKELDNKSKNKYIQKEDLIKTLQDFMIRKEDIEGLINNWEYKDNLEAINIDDLTNHLKQREIIINDVIDINNELKFGNDIGINIEYNLNEKDESANESKSEYSIKNNNNENNINNYNNNIKEKENYAKIEVNENNLKKSDTNKIINENKNFINNEKISNENNIDNNNIEKENEENNEYNIKNDNEKVLVDDNNEKENQDQKEEEKENQEEENYDDFNNQVGEEEEKNDDNNNISNEIEQNKSDNENEINNNIIEQEEEDKKDIESPSTSKKKKKKSTSKKKKKTKKSKEKLNIDDIINGELKVQVQNIENVMISDKILLPCSFSLTCSIEGIDKMLKSREVVTDDLRNVKFNWATRILLKKRTLKELSSFCNINLSVEQKNKNISLGNCQFPWTKCLYKNNWDKFAINEFFQVLTERKYKKIPMGNIKILAKFIPFGSKNSNYDKKGKKKKTPTNLNGIAEELSAHSSISNKNEINENNENNEENNIIENIENKEENENNVNEDSLDGKKVNIEEPKEESEPEEEFIEENQGNQIIKEFDVEITNVNDKEQLMDKNLYLSVAAIEDGFEQEKINKEKFNERLQNLPTTINFSVYSYKNNNRIKVIFYLKNEEDKVIGKLPIILSNKESHLEKTDNFNIKMKDDNKNYSFFLKITINTTEDI